MKAFGANWGVFAAFLVVAGGVSLLTAFTTMPPLDENGRPVVFGGRFADAAPGASRQAQDSDRTDPFVFALEMTNPWSQPSDAQQVATAAVEVEPGVSIPAQAQEPAASDSEPLAAEMLEIGRHLAAIAPAAGSQDQAISEAPLIDSAVAESAPRQVAQLPSARGPAGPRTETLFGSYRATEDSAHQWGTASAREVAAETAAKADADAPAEAAKPKPAPAEKSAKTQGSGTTLATMAATAPAAGDAGAPVVASKPNAARSTIPRLAAEGRYVVIGSFKRLANARALQRERQSWAPEILSAEVKGQQYHRVVLGPFSKAEAKQVRLRMSSHGVKDAWTLAPPKGAAMTLRRSAELDLAPAG